MISEYRRAVLTLFAIAAMPLQCAGKQYAMDAVIAKYDRNHDHGLDLAEVRAAASAHFDALNRDGDTTLETSEAREIVGPQMFARADTDHDGTLSKEEYLALVERLFRKTDTEHFGRLYARDLSGKAAHALLKLIQ